jgi:hypothetical protein
MAMAGAVPILEKNPELPRALNHLLLQNVGVKLSSRHIVLIRRNVYTKQLLRLLLRLTPASFGRRIIGASVRVESPGLHELGSWAGWMGRDGRERRRKENPKKKEEKRSGYLGETGVCHRGWRT